ncbi:MAG: glycine cleavage system aminomethyltransferase GcvT [Deltaproteobacteria bacterium]|nr:glycine cleavage system aminomethyltransferase GcvT [Deltaproteobacteria bacterium]
MDNEYKEIFYSELKEYDREIFFLSKVEEVRQLQKVILIPSESITPYPVRVALSTAFVSIYTEGYPPIRMTREEEKKITDYCYQMSRYRRYADRRFYKGCDIANLIEVLAQRRAARLFATENLSEDKIYVNVQPLSGAAANNAIYEAFVQPGDVVMGMALSEGGHLTHGSPFNRSGKRYTIVSYCTDPKTELLDYDKIMEQAKESRPKMIIAGWTSYPWAPDWKKFKEIADEVGARLVADVSHPAGLIVAGVYPNPIEYCDAVMCTTHKTLCGPRGAIILTKDESVAAKIDNAVFPGEQGGPHVNKMAAMAVAFKIAESETFKEMMRQIVKNASAMADQFVKKGLKLANNGTNTHMLLIDLNKLPNSKPVPVKGEIAARILELCGIVLNKNTIAGDPTAAHASALRIGTPWITQRGYKEKEVRELADIITDIIFDIRPFFYQGLTGPLPRGKVELSTIERGKKRVFELNQSVVLKSDERIGYPFIPFVQVGDEKGDYIYSDEKEAFVEMSEYGIFEVSGERPRHLLHQVLTADVINMRSGDTLSSPLFDASGKLIDFVNVFCVQDEIEDRFILLCNPHKRNAVLEYLRNISDGYIIFDKEDITKKVEGPANVIDLQLDPILEKKFKGILFSPSVLKNVEEILSVKIGDVGGKAGNNSYIFNVRSLDGRRFVVALVVTDAYNSIKEVIRNAGLKEIKSNSIILVKREDEELHIREFCNKYPQFFKREKVYFVGEPLLRDLFIESSKGISKEIFAFENRENELKRTPIYEWHRKNAQKIIPFAGWEMPVWYTSILDEHNAVRNTAGLFDVAHMGVLEVKGKSVESFLNIITANYASWILPGQSQYSYLLDQDGNVIDDIMLYRRSKFSYMIVVNASNAEKDLTWMNYVNSGKAILCKKRPYLNIDSPVEIRDLKDKSAGEEMRIDISLQGKMALPTLLDIISDQKEKQRLRSLRRTEFLETEIEKESVIISRTGYTGEEVGFELYIHPDKAMKLWELILEAGKKYQVKPCGLGARDSLRTEAGLPLYGHELAGPFNISPAGAGFSPYVKLHKPFFIGRDAFIEAEKLRTMEIVRFIMTNKISRPAKQKDIVVSAQGVVIGFVTSSAFNGEGFQVGLAYVDRKYIKEGGKIGVYCSPQTKLNVTVGEEMKVGDRIVIPEPAVILPRFDRKKKK